MVIFLLCATMIVTWRWPQTPVGRLLHRLTVEWPARQLAKLDPGGALFVLLMLFAIAMAILVARNDGLIFLVQGFPDAVAWFAAFDIATYLDVTALVVVLSATVRLRTIYSALRAWIGRSAPGRLMQRRHGARGRSRRPEGRRQPPSNDDEPAWWDLGLAFG